MPLHSHPVFSLTIKTPQLNFALLRHFLPTFDFINFSCGVREIRTPDTLSGYTNFPGLPLQPLEHHSLLFCGAKLGNYYIFYNCFSTKSSNFSAPQAPHRLHLSHEGAPIGIF